MSWINPQKRISACFSLLWWLPQGPTLKGLLIHLQGRDDSVGIHGETIDFYRAIVSSTAWSMVDIRVLREGILDSYEVLTLAFFLARTRASLGEHTYCWNCTVVPPGTFLLWRIPFNGSTPITRNGSLIVSFALEGPQILLHLWFCSASKTSNPSYTDSYHWQKTLRPELK